MPSSDPMRRVEEKSQNSSQKSQKNHPEMDVIVFNRQSNDHCASSLKAGELIEVLALCFILG